jgi:hypothetical protein
MALAASRRADHQDFHPLSREIENLSELLMDLAVHLDGRAVGNLNDNLFGFRPDLAQRLKGQLADHLGSDWPAHVNPIAFLAGLAVLPLGRVGVGLARGHIADVAKGSNSLFPGLRHMLRFRLALLWLFW